MNSKLELKNEISKPEDVDQCEPEQFPRLMLKKIRKEVQTGQTILHLSNKQEAITEMLAENNLLTKISDISLDDLQRKTSRLKDLGITKAEKAFTYVLVDLDLEASDNLEEFLLSIAPLVIRPGLIIVLAKNLCSWTNKFNLFFNNAPSNYHRPNRALAPNYLRQLVLEAGFFPKNRYWQYDDKILMMLDIPKKY
ncbi:MAG: hypothetical protein MK033_11195 [Candidatus Caenarcaniphilales bacterium]|nr:hypothetical protein [Candidatus Caenarcaniphilales bacterium]